MHLVDDHRAHRAQHVARGRGEHQEQRLGGGDEDVRRAAGDGAPLGRARVAAAHPDRHARRGLAEADGRLGDAGQRGAQVALDVDGQRLKGGDVEDAAALLRLRDRLAAVDEDFYTLRPDGSLVTQSTAAFAIAETLERLDVRPGTRVLEIGTGSGFSGALLSELVGPTSLLRCVSECGPLREQARNPLSTRREHQRADA